MWSPSLEDDLNALYDISTPHGLLVDEFFDLLEDDYSVRYALTLAEFSRIPRPRLETGPVVSAIRAGLNICRVKIWDEDGSLVAYRILYAVHHKLPNPKILILGLMPRSDDYDNTSDFGQRVRRDYDNFGIDYLGR